MISKERLEELINQGATIYWICGKQIEAKPLKHKYHKFFINDDELCEYNEQLGIGMWQQKLSKLFETKEDAEWDKEFGCIEKIERLWFPTWESVYNDLKDYKDGNFYILDNDHFSFVYNKGYITPQLFLYTHNEKFNWNANKENYYQACKLAKKIFLGGENE